MIAVQKFSVTDPALVANATDYFEQFEPVLVLGFNHERNQYVVAAQSVKIGNLGLPTQIFLFDEAELLSIEEALEDILSLAELI